MTAIAAAIARLLERPESPVDPPSWLLPAQGPPFRQAVAAVEAHGGVLLALRIGSGKTYVGLALGAHFSAGEPIDVIGPALLREHWFRSAAALALTIRYTSFEAASRGQVARGRGPVVIDESHRLRHPHTRRYRAIAPAVTGRPVVLLTATPTVNRTADLAAQLLLGIRDDALRGFGVPSIARQLDRGPVTAAFAAVVITNAEASEEQPVRQAYSIDDWSAGDREFLRLVRSIDRLRLAKDGPVARLLRTSLFRAAASSPAALLASVGRYRRLLDHAAAARRAGHSVSRAGIRSVTEADPEQLVLWEVLAPERLAADLALGDRRGLARLERRVRARLAGADRKLDRLVQILADRRPTVLFTTSVDTLHYLRRQALGVSVAWVTGSAAGVGWTRASRSAVLDAFDPATARPGIKLPDLLLASDVAAEGLNLRRAGRIIHYDLPWTAVRLDQRDGRAIRQGSAHAAVEVVEFRVPPLLEQRIGLEAAIGRKRLLPEASRALGGLGRTPAFAGAGCRTDVVAGIEGPAAAVAGFTIMNGGSTPRSLVLSQRGTEPWVDDRSGAQRLLHQAEAGAPVEIRIDELGAIRAELDQAASDWLQAQSASGIGSEPIGAAALAIVARQIRAAEMRRSKAAILEAETVLRFLGRGHTAGERILADRISAGDPAAFSEAGRPGPAREDGPPVATLVGLVVFREPDRSTSFPE